MDSRDNEYFEEYDDLNSQTDDADLREAEMPDDLFDNIEEIDEEFDDEDGVEMERRRTRYAELKKDDKIFNNTYNMGYDTSSEDEDLDESGSSIREIKVDASSPDYFMYDREQYADYVDQSIVQKEIFAFIQKSEEVNQILGPEPERKKFQKSEINELFSILCKNLITKNNKNYFITPIYVLDAISITVSSDYKKLFDMLNYENKEVLLLELNSKYGFLDKLTKSNKMF